MIRDARIGQLSTKEAWTIGSKARTQPWERARPFEGLSRMSLVYPDHGIAHSAQSRRERRLAGEVYGAQVVASGPRRMYSPPTLRTRPE